MNAALHVKLGELLLATTKAQNKIAGIENFEQGFIERFPLKTYLMLVKPAQQCEAKRKADGASKSQSLSRPLQYSAESIRLPSAPAFAWPVARPAPSNPFSRHDIQGTIPIPLPRHGA